MSIGGAQPGKQSLVEIAINNLDQANLVIAVAAGNSGPGAFTASAPGTAERALTAGASTVPHFVGSQVLAEGNTYNAATGDFNTVTSDLKALLAVVREPNPHPDTGLAQACQELSAGSLTGKIALISRGTCSFSTKIRNAQTAGAEAVLVVNSVAGDPIAMGTDGTDNQPAIPAYMLSKDDGVTLANLKVETVTIGAPAYISTGAPGQDIMAGFSSQGPTDVDFPVKPDVVAPGVNVLSAQPSTACSAAPCWAFFQGTSMATPDLAGSAAVVLQQHPAWTAAQVRSAIVNTADQGVLKSYQDGTTPATDVNIVGAGRENLAKAVAAKVSIEPVSISFGAVSAGAGQTKTFDVTLTNLSGAEASYALKIDNGMDTGVRYTAGTSLVELAKGASATVTITMTADKGASLGGHQAMLRISSGGSEIAHAAVYTLVK